MTQIRKIQITKTQIRKTQSGRLKLGQRRSGRCKLGWHRSGRHKLGWHESRWHGSVRCKSRRRRSGWRESGWCESGRHRWKTRNWPRWMSYFFFISLHCSSYFTPYSSRMLGFRDRHFLLLLICDHYWNRVSLFSELFCSFQCLFFVCLLLFSHAIPFLHQYGHSVFFCFLLMQTETKM